MLTPTVKPLPHSRIELAFLVTPEEAKPYLEQAVMDISTEKPLPGFRPGKATYEDVKRTYGEMRIWEGALERLVRALYVKAVLQHDIETVGSPEIAVQKLVPGQAIEFTAAVSTMPKVERLAEYAKPMVTRKAHAVADTEVDAAIADLQKMRRIEAVSDKPATKDGMALIDLDIEKDHVAIEGGSSKNYRVYLAEASYIPGFSDKLVGAKKGDALSFELPFPEDHYNKQLAGQNLTFKVNVHDVYTLELPAIDDAFAKSVGLDDLAALRSLLKENIQKEQDQKADEAAEIEMLEKLTADSRFGEIPELLTNEEVRRMVHELQHSIEERGGNFKDYLQSVKKTEQDIKMDFVAQAIKRIQTAVLIKEIGKRENISVTDEEVDTEIDRILLGIRPDDKEAREHIASPEYRDYVAIQLKNRKIIELLKQKTISS